MKIKNLILIISCMTILTSCGEQQKQSTAQKNTSGMIVSTSNKDSNATSEDNNATKKNAIKAITSAIKEADGYDENWNMLRLREDDAYRAYSTLDLTVDEDSNSFGFSAIDHYKHMPEGVEFGRVVVNFYANSLPEGVGWFGDESVQNPVFTVEYNLPENCTSSSRDFNVLFEKNYNETKLTDTNAKIEYHSLTMWGLTNLKKFLKERSLDLSAFLPDF